MDEPAKMTCETCRHFYRHYVRVGNHKYRALDCGHCSNPRCRDKTVDTPACQRFSRRPETKQATS